MRRVSEHRSAGKNRGQACDQNQQLMGGRRINAVPQTKEVERKPKATVIGSRPSPPRAVRLTRQVGWDGRRSEKVELEYYSLVRYLRFEQFKYQLRNSIINGLNEGFSKIRRSWTAPKIVQNVFPSQKDIDEANTKLHEGTIGFSELFKPFMR